eukprot:TRINITY_DN30123_c0_g1_i1.p1 TRINITY_DN30123_c0_g1~~TRINITY_DN30123_c0_g1_i1.p1  ORF type:complete len:1120 (+),score=465.88 TRINITY_DN30123_c0_g1_i1:203-3361(+)
MAASQFGGEEKAILSSVMARLQRGIDVSGEQERAYVAQARQQGQAPQHGAVEAPYLNAQVSELRQQLDRAGIVIAQQLETSSRKDILVQQIEAFNRLERLHAQMQIERIYDHLTGEREHMFLAEQQFAKKLDALRAQNAEDKLAYTQAAQDFEERMECLAEQNAEAVNELERRLDLLRQQSRAEQQEAAERMAAMMAEAEARRREDRREQELKDDVLYLEKEEADMRVELLHETIEEFPAQNIVFEKYNADDLDELSPEQQRMLELEQQLEDLQGQMAQKEEEFAEELQTVRDALEQQMDEQKQTQENDCESAKQALEEQLQQDRDEAEQKLAELKEELQAKEEAARQEAEEREAKRQRDEEVREEADAEQQRTWQEKQEAYQNHVAELENRVEEVAHELQQQQQENLQKVADDYQGKINELDALVEALRGELDDALTKQYTEDQRRERDNLQEMVAQLQEEIMLNKEEHDLRCLELESNLMVLGKHGEQGGANATVVNLSQDTSLYIEELLQTQQDAGRYFIMLQQLQEYVCFVIQRYAPHWSMGEDAMTDEERELAMLHQHRSIYPSYWGWLYKSSGMFVTWQRRFFILRDGVLKMSPTGDIGVEEEWETNAACFKTVLKVDAVARVELETFKDVSQGNHPPTGKYESFGFMVETYSRQKIKFCCTSSSERAEWMNVFRKCNEIRLTNDRFRACNGQGESQSEPYLYLEDCSPPGPPPTYRTRVRMNDAGAYPMVGPGSPRREALQAIPHYESPHDRAAGRTGARNLTMRQQQSMQHTSPPPPRPVLIMGAKAKSGHPRRAQQVGGASGVGRPHRVDGPDGWPGASPASTPHATPQRRPSRTPMSQARTRQSPAMSGLGHPTTPPSHVPVHMSGGRSSGHSEAVMGDQFDGTVPLDVLLVKASGEAEEEEEELELITATAHSFYAKFKGSYEKIQIYHCGQDRGCVLAARVYQEVLGTGDNPLCINAEPQGVQRMLNNMAAQPTVPGSPSSLLIVLIGSSLTPCTLDTVAVCLGDDGEPLPVHSAALYSSLYAAHRSGVSWECVTKVDGA